MKIENHTINNKRYLSEVISELPSKALINKGVTGCGGTHLELISQRDSIILVPTIELVKNKYKEGYLAIHGKVKDSEIDEYLNSDIPFKKIIGTYDCLKRIITKPNIKNFFLLIDEYHILFNSYSFRNETILYILKNYSKFNDYCFMTATPLEDDIILDEIKHLPRINYIWEDAIKINLTLKDTTYTSKELLKILLMPEEDVNYHIFVNSIKTIKDLVNKSSISDYKVVCSETSRASIKAMKTGTTLDKVCKFNFYTSTAFEGCDIYDRIGKTIILCDTNIATTILDISTLIRQICGRLRDSIYKENVTLILNTSKHRYAGITESIFKQGVLHNIEKAKARIDVFESANETFKESELQLYNVDFQSIYLNKMDDNIFYDDNLRKMDEYNYRLIHSIYKNSICVLKEATKYNMEVKIERSPKTKEVFGVSLDNYEYSFEELEELFSEIFKQKGIKFGGATIKNYFPKFEKVRLCRDNVRKLYYRFY